MCLDYLIVEVRRKLFFFRLIEILLGAPVSYDCPPFHPPRHRVSLWSLDCSVTHFIVKAGLQLTGPPASASCMPGLKCALPYHECSY